MEGDAPAYLEAAAPGLDPETAFQLGDQARRKRWYRSGLPLLMRAEAASTDPTAARVGLIECHRALRNWMAALAAAERVLADDPRHRRALRHKAYLLARLGRDDEALGTLEIYASVARRWAEPFADMARLHAGRRDWARVVAAAFEALSRHSSDVHVLELLIDGLVALGREAETAEWFARLARGDPNRVVRTVRMYLRMGRPLAAVHAYRGLAEGRGDSAEVAATLLMLCSALLEKPVQGSGFSSEQSETALAVLKDWSSSRDEASAFPAASPSGA